MKKILIINFSDNRGGAAKAAYTQVRAARLSKKSDVTFLVAEKQLEGSVSIGPSKLQFYTHFLLRLCAHAYLKLQRDNIDCKHSLNYFSAPNVIAHLKTNNYDVVHLHWIQNETLSLKHLRHLIETRPNTHFVITLHDEWLYLGAEHCALGNTARHEIAYTERPETDRGIDINKQTYKRKQQLFKTLETKRVTLTAPSRFIMQRLKSSPLFNGISVKLIPNIIDTKQFTKSENKEYFERNRIDLTIPIVLFGAIDGKSYLKGSDLFDHALKLICERSSHNNFQLVSFGGSTPQTSYRYGRKHTELGHVSDRKLLASIYSHAHCTVVPSRLEAFGQVAAESLACETPVVGFSNSGIRDIVTHCVTGFLADKVCSIQLAEQIQNMLGRNREQKRAMGQQGRLDMLARFSVDAIKPQWDAVYGEN